MILLRIPRMVRSVEVEVDATPSPDVSLESFSDSSISLRDARGKSPNNYWSNNRFACEPIILSRDGV